jgi:hypothetical protein
LQTCANVSPEKGERTSKFSLDSRHFPFINKRFVSICSPISLAFRAAFLYFALSREIWILLESADYLTLDFCCAKLSARKIPSLFAEKL